MPTFEDTPIIVDDRECMLTTVDNPFSPFTQWNDWLRYDRDQGYYTNEYLARIAETDDLLSNEQNEEAIRVAMEEIVNENPTKLWVIVYKDTKNSDSSNSTRKSNNN